MRCRSGGSGQDAKEVVNGVQKEVVDWQLTNHTGLGYRGLQKQLQGKAAKLNLFTQCVEIRVDGGGAGPRECQHTRLACTVEATCAMCNSRHVAYLRTDR